MKRKQKAPLVAGLPEFDVEAERREGYKIKSYFLDNGPYRRELYPKHQEFFAAGASHRERLMLAANRIGKSEAGAYETALHLIGQYPDWWKGRRFDSAVRFWAAGDSGRTVRDIVQEKLLGPPGALGTGLIPAHLIDHWAVKPGIASAVDTVRVRHISGGISVLEFMSYDQRREAFQGTAQHGIWLDEEPPEDIYTECLLRTTKTGNFPGGMVMMTFTPIQGYTPLVQRFLPSSLTAPNYNDQSKFVVTATWDDVPHLSTDEKNELRASLPRHERDARTRGIPQLGAGAIYPVSEEDIVVDDFPIPEHWPRGYGLDVGWKVTAAVWGALNRDTGQSFLYAVHHQAETEPLLHAAAIKRHGTWIPGRIDPSALGRGQTDGRKLIEIYSDFGLELSPAPNAVEAGIHKVWTLLSTGQLKVLASLTPWFDEFRLYRRNAQGKVVKEHDHLMDATRYFILSGVDWLKTEPPKPDQQPYRYQTRSPGSYDWMAS